MIFSRKFEYGLRALVHLAQAGRVCDVGEISQKQKAPYHFVAKVLQELKGRGFVKSVRGAGGGFTLARLPRQVVLLDVVKALEGDQFLSSCLYGLDECSDSVPCPLHQDWKAIRNQMETYLQTHSLAELAEAESANQPRT